MYMYMQIENFFKKLYIVIILIKKFIRYLFKFFDVEKSKKFEKICKVYVYVFY